MFYLLGPSFVLLLLCKKVFVEFGFVSPLGPFLFYFRVQNIGFLTHAFERGQIKTVYFRVFLKYIATAALWPTVSILIASNMCIVSASETCLFLSRSDFHNSGCVVALLHATVQRNACISCEACLLSCHLFRYKYYTHFFEHVDTSKFARRAEGVSPLHFVNFKTSWFWHISVSVGDPWPVEPPCSQDTRYRSPSQHCFRRARPILLNVPFVSAAGSVTMSSRRLHVAMHFTRTCCEMEAHWRFDCWLHDIVYVIVMYTIIHTVIQ